MWDKLWRSSEVTSIDDVRAIIMALGVIALIILFLGDLVEINKSGNFFHHSPRLKWSAVVIMFVVIPFKNKGMTPGKYLINIRVVKKDNKDASVNDLFIRTLINTGMLFIMIDVVLLLLLKESGYSVIAYIIQITSIGTMFTIVIMILLRNDKRGLHDLLAQTKVVENKLGVKA
mgnify:CR=1 FL=1